MIFIIVVFKSPRIDCVSKIMWIAHVIKKNLKKKIYLHVKIHLNYRRSDYIETT